MYKRGTNEGYRQALEGVTQKTLVYGDQTLMAEFRLDKGAQLPFHSHPHEQTGYLVRGRLKLTIDTDSHEVMPGDSWCIPGGVAHCAESHEDSVALEVFAPVREDYLP